MKKIIVLLIFLMAGLLQPFHAISKVDQSLQFEDSLNYQMIDYLIKELEPGFFSSNHLKSGTVNNNLPDSTHLYQFNTIRDSVLKERTLYNYDLAGRVKTEILYKWNQFVNKMLDFTYENSYDPTGKIISKRYNGWDFQILFYKLFDVFDEGTIYKDSTVAIPAQGFYDYKYDRMGNPTTVWRITFDKYNIPTAIKCTCSYDSEGNRTSIKSSGSIIINNRYEYGAYTEDYTYGSEKRLATVTQSRLHQYNYVPVWFCSSKIKYEYAYDSDNRVTNILSYYWSPTASEWHNVSKVDYTYQANGALVSRLYSIIDTSRNELMQVDRTDFKYNKNNKIQLREDYAWNKTTSLWEIRKKQYYYYNLDSKARLIESNMASEMPFCIFPNPVKDILWIENRSGDSSPMHIYNSNGQCVKTDRIEKGMNTISLIQLPKGIYFITIPYMKELKVSKLIIE